MGFSVVVPAHNEATVIDRLLTALAPDPKVEVLVVANGCTDDTADRARRHPGVGVLELPTGNKAAALAAGDAAANRFPRFFVDADIVVDKATLARCAELMASTDAPACSPSAVFDDTRSSWAVRKFYTHFRTTPYVRGNLLGLGVYGLSESGRGRFHTFPDLIADDLFVSGLFESQERVVAPDASFMISAPRNLSALLAVRQRTYLGNRQAAAAGLTGSLHPATSRDALTTLSSARNRTAAIVYYAVNAAAKLRAARAWKRSDLSWNTDTTTRT